MKQAQHPSLFITLLILFFSNQVSAQFNLNRFNGLPTNHVYMYLKDRHGYLWIATAKGVLRYNGYEFNLFNISQELGSNDVWRIYKDRKERIWLYSFSNSFGYIYKNKYYKKVEQKHVINPGNFIYENETGLMISKNRVVLGATPANGHWLYSETYNEKKKIKCDVFTQKGNSALVYHFNGDSFNLVKECVCPPVDSFSQLYGNRLIRYRNHIFLFLRKKDHLVYLNLDSCLYRTIIDEKSNPKGFSYIQPPENRESDPRDYIYVYYKDLIEKRDSMLNLMETFRVKKLTRAGVSGHDLVYLLEDSLWGKCVATESYGGFITPLNTNTPFRKFSWDATGFTLLKVLNNHTAYWWNEQTHVLARIEAGKRPVLRQHKNLRDIARIFGYNAQYDILFTFTHYYKIDKRTGKLSAPLSYSHYPSGQHKPGSVSKMYSVSNQSLSVYLLTNRTASSKILMRERFREVLEDPVRHGHWAYNQHTLYFITSRDSCIAMKALLKNLGIVQLERLLVSPVGNLLLLTPNKLICYNMLTRTATELLTNCNLADTRISMTGRTLVAAGRYGVAFTETDATGQYKPPVIYHNIKDNYYFYINDIQVLKDSVLLQTNAGTYIVGIPHNIDSVAHADLPFRLLVQYADSTYSEKDDVVNIVQQNNVLHLDLVRPAGNGKLKFLYRIMGMDSAWLELNGNALVLPALETGRHYNLAVIAKDDVWQSNITGIRLFVKPLWWQSYPGLQLVWFVSFLLAGGILLLTVLITRRLIEKRSARQKQLLELELKAVYAQINPHFIFNTLNSGLHFIKRQRTDEAYQHILRFSQLLRAYLKASRHRYITLAQEVQNLENYIGLQQTRYGHIFEYSIVLDDIPYPEHISIPSLLLQPIVENAIEHGLLPKEQHGRLDISFRVNPEKKQLVCMVSDDGIGRNRSKQNKTDGAEKKESYGNDLIRELTHIFNKYEKMGIEISYSDLPEPKTGTVVKIVIKNPRLSYE
jgi:hypothetical protein